MDRIVDDAIQKGLAKTKTEVLRMGLMELKNKYRLAEDDLTDEQRDQLKKFLLKIKEDKEGNHGTEEDLWKALGRTTR
ncbi:hypothetical protein HY994_02670 [Candidatus Micrarchaeota archaeon]|nr:hypothetical protein [Candidatus Micrarchaeota archaeon]